MIMFVHESIYKRKLTRLCMHAYRYNYINTNDMKTSKCQFSFDVRQGY